MIFTFGWMASAGSGAFAQTTRQTDAPLSIFDPTAALDPTGNGTTTNGNATNSTANGANAGRTANTADTNASSSRIEPTRVDQANGQSGDDQEKVDQGRLIKPAPPSEFETYVERVVGRKVPRFGAELLVPASRDFALPATATVPPSYMLNPGDEVAISMTGSVQGSVEATIDSDGRIFIPEVGPMTLAGVRYGDLRAAVTRAIGRQYRNFQVAVTIGRLRGIRVYVTGFANQPGAYTVSSLSSLVNAMLQAGGPAAGGSFRAVQLFRNGRLVSSFDLYDLLRNGDRSRDAVLQNEDVLYIPPVGAQIALVGSVKDEAIYEAKPGETLAQLLGYGGGINALGDQSRAMLYSIGNLDTIGGVQIAAADLGRTAAKAGDVLQILSLGDIARPLERQAILVKLEGEVTRPGNYYVAPGSTLAQVVEQAGGFTPRAFIYGTEFDRVSVRRQQRQAFDEAISQLQLALAAAPLNQGPTSDTASRSEQVVAARAVVERLRQAEPTGRVVLDLAPTATSLRGDTALENNDRFYIPPRPTTVGVFGAVYRPGSFEYAGERKLRAYLDRAGGPQRSGDTGQIFVVRANGEVISRSRGALGKAVLPGDVLFVPVKTQSNSILARLRDISAIVFQLGLSAAAVVALTR